MYRSDVHKLLRVLFPVILVLLFFETALRLTPDGYSKKVQVLERNKENAEVLITGNSQALYGINPEWLSLPAINLAFVNQDLWYDRQVILHSVLLQLNYLSFGYRLDKISESWRCAFYANRFNFDKPYDEILLRDFSFLALYTPRIALSWLRNGFQSSGTFTMNQFGFESVPPSASVAVSDSSAAFWTRRHQSFMSFENFPRNARILEDLADSLLSRNIQLVIVSAPLTPGYRKFCDSGILMENNRIVSRLVSSGKALYWDFRSDSDFLKQDFLDDYHLNHNGGQKWSAKIDAVIKKTGF
jgi:hypothetical protein